MGPQRHRSSVFTAVTGAIVVGLSAAGAHAGVTFSTQPLTASWPGTPTIVTYAAPNLPNTAASRVPENFSGTRPVSQTFQATSNFNLGGVALSIAGGGSPTEQYSLNLWDVTLGGGLPGNYRPSTDGPTPGVNLLTAPLVTFAGNANDVLLVAEFDAADQPALISGRLYAFEIQPVASYAASGMNWIRGGGAISTYAPGSGYEVNSGNGNTTPFTAPTNFRTLLAGSDRDLVLAVYAPGQIPEPASIGLIGLAAAGLIGRRRR